VTQVRFHRAAADEAEAAVRWYNERVPGLGGDFRLELFAGIERIREQPHVWPFSAYDQRARRFLLARFPYSIVYLAGNDDIVTVVAVAHAKRRPGYWRRR
jgi:plasmid stabilization system protein ParE